MWGVAWVGWNGERWLVYWEVYTYWCSRFDFSKFRGRGWVEEGIVMWGALEEEVEWGQMARISWGIYICMSFNVFLSDFIVVEICFWLTQCAVLIVVAIILFQLSYCVILSYSTQAYITATWQKMTHLYRPLARDETSIQGQGPIHKRTM